MKKFCLLLSILLLLAGFSSVDAALTKGVAAVDEWAAVVQDTVREGATTSLTAFYTSALHIDMALTSAVTHTGTKIDVQVSSNTSGDEDWTTLVAFTGPYATVAAPNPEALAGAEAAGQTVLGVASTTGLYDEDETRWIFLLDNVVVDSELCYLVSHVTNASVTVLDGTTNAHDASDVLWDVAKTYTIKIPVDYSRVRVIFDNTLDSDGAQVHCRTRISTITGL